MEGPSAKASAAAPVKGEAMLVIDAQAILSALHGKCFRHIGEAAQRSFKGLGETARHGWRSGLVDSSLKKQLIALDVAVAWCGQASGPRSQTFFDQLRSRCGSVTGSGRGSGGGAALGSGAGSGGSGNNGSGSGSGIGSELMSEEVLEVQLGSSTQDCRF